MPSNKDFESLRIKIIVRAWKDPKFRERLLKNPKAVMKEMGVVFPNTLKVNVIEDKSNSFTFVLPSHPAQTKEISERELEKIAAAGGTLLCSFGCTMYQCTTPAC